MGVVRSQSLMRCGHKNCCGGRTRISELIELAFYNLLSKGGLPDDIIKSSEGRSPTICKFASSLTLLSTYAGRP